MALKKHSPFVDNIPAYALGALDAQDASGLEVHLQTCASCRDELAAYRALSDGLLVAMPPVQPPASLRRRLGSNLPGARRRSLLRPMKGSWGQFALGLALVILLLLNAFSFLQMQSFQQQQVSLSRQLQSEQTALALLSYPGVKTISFDTNGISGSLLLDEDRNAVAIFAWNLPQLPADHTFQAWLIDPKGERTSLGIFRSDSGLPFTTFSVISSNNIEKFVGLGVTSEPSGGSDHPTGARLFKVDF
jgi:anti-sigma-K factor RskA